jgi:ubiquinone biosynthesis accessory factor UbiJ
VALFPDPRSLPAEALVRAVNHLLAGQPWLRESLVPHAGRTCRLEVFPVLLQLRVGEDGALQRDSGTHAPDAIIRLSAFAAARLLAGEERARAEVDLSGDPVLASALRAVLQELRWDAEEDLSRVVGDIAARRIVQGARRAASWQASAAQSIGANLAEYLVEERALLARKDEVQRWSQEVGDLRDAVERLEKRLETLAPTPAPRA